MVSFLGVLFLGVLAWGLLALLAIIFLKAGTFFWGAGGLLVVGFGIFLRISAANLSHSCFLYFSIRSFSASSSCFFTASSSSRLEKSSHWSSFPSSFPTSIPFSFFKTFSSTTSSVAFVTWRFVSIWRQSSSRLDDSRFPLSDLSALAGSGSSLILKFSITSLTSSCRSLDTNFVSTSSDFFF